MKPESLAKLSINSLYNSPSPHNLKKSFYFLQTISNIAFPKFHTEFLVPRFLLNVVEQPRKKERKKKKRHVTAEAPPVSPLLCVLATLADIWPISIEPPRGERSEERRGYEGGGGGGRARQVTRSRRGADTSIQAPSVPSN